LATARFGFKTAILTDGRGGFSIIDSIGSVITSNNVS
jgi:hypothetical protein